MIQETQPRLDFSQNRCGDGGGVAAGSFTVPMLLALGMGFTSVLGNRSYLSDGFGLIGLACAGPIIGLLVLGMFFF